ncbi:hypothetical protein C8J57DRAFT_1382004 [Mycena rebaudengoi]|nr:hypothetical protein C8J57DRAFT_1382004 [Mycena rebaudengoi]
MGSSKLQRPHPRPSNTPRRPSLLWLLPASAIAVFAYYFFDKPFELFSPANEHAGSDPFFLTELPGKGKGYVAARDIRQGELLIKETPLFTIPASASDYLSSHFILELIWDKLQNLDPVGREVFFNLSYSRLPEGLNPVYHPDEVALAIFQTNSVTLGEDAGICPVMARLNHGCSSAVNSVYSWRQDEGALVVYALSDIQQGQELLVTYMDTKQSRTERRKHLSEHYGFNCSCSVCSLGPAESKASDERLTTIAKLYGDLAAWGGSSITGSEAIATINEIFKLEEEEGYWSQRGRLTADATWVAAAHSDALATRQWAELAVKWATIELGAGSEAVKEVEESVTHPERHRAWGTREVLTVAGPIGSA